jgi:hypothetical protein
VGLHNIYHGLCGAIGEECSIVDLWFSALLQTLLLHISFKVRGEDILLEFRARSREMMIVFRNFLSDHSG